MSASSLAEWTVLPWGFCPECLERMRDGAQYAGIPLPHEQGVLFHGYCEHREVGAEIVIRPDRPPRWRLHTPIDALEWAAHMAPGALAARFNLVDVMRRVRPSEKK